MEEEQATEHLCGAALPTKTYAVNVSGSHEIVMAELLLSAPETIICTPNEAAVAGS